jgi:phosphoglycolate phosphatase-like HAD superfamily hydrolase
MIRNIIFDWSGTISDDIRQVYETTMDIFDYYKIEKIPFECFKETIELPYQHFLKKFVPNIDTNEAYALFRKFFDKKDKPKPFPDAEEALAYLQSRGIRMVALSAHHLVKQQAKEYFPHKNFFMRIYDDVEDKKKVIASILEDLNFKPEESLLVGDMVHDIETGRKAVIKTAAVLRGYHSRIKLERANPDFILNDLSELKNLI